MRIHKIYFLLFIVASIFTFCSLSSKNNLTLSFLPSDSWNHRTRNFDIKALPFLVIKGDIGLYFKYYNEDSHIQGLCTESQFKFIVKALDTWREQREEFLKELRNIGIKYIFNISVEKVGFIPLITMLAYLKYPPSSDASIIYWEIFSGWRYSNVIEGEPPTESSATLKVFRVATNLDKTLVAYELPKDEVRRLINRDFENLRIISCNSRKIILSGEAEGKAYKKVAFPTKEFNVIVYPTYSPIKGSFDVAFPGFFVINVIHPRFFSFSEPYILAGGLWMVCAPAFDFLWENPAPEKGFSPKGLDWFRDDPLYKRYVCGE